MEHHIDEGSLAQRWGLSRRTLQRWRSSCTGPAYHLLGRRVTYDLADVAAFEAASRVETLSTKSPHREVPR